MRVSSQPKQKIQIPKLPHHQQYRTQQSSPINLQETQTFNSQHLAKPAIIKTVKNGFGTTVRPLRSFKNSKEKNKQEPIQRFPIFDVQALKNSLGNEEAPPPPESFGEKKKKCRSHRISTEKKNPSEEEQNQRFPSDRRSGENRNKITFRLGNKPRSLQKTEKTENPAQCMQFNLKNIISFSKNSKIKFETEKNAEYQHTHRSIEKYQKKMSPFEKQEIGNYQLWYIGPRRIHCKSDFTDSEGDPKVMIHDSIAYRYEIISQLGRGSFGKVYRAYDHKKKEYVALKLIKSQKKFQEQAKVEVQILQTSLLQDPRNRCNIVKMRSSFVFRAHSCITFEILHKNLYQFLKEHQFSGFSHDLIRRFSIQILQALNFLKKKSIIHCDLKPENILLKEENKSGIKVIDVGSGCFEDKQLYTYIQSRFYRAPEIILGIRYTPAIDMWSFGCILAELFTGFPIFPGDSENEQMLLFFEILGYPSKEILKYAERRKKFFNEDFECKIPQEPGKEKVAGSVKLQQVVGSSDPEFLDMIRKCLEWDPRRRLTPHEALVHPWILKGLPEEIRLQHIQEMKDEFSY